MSGAARGRIGPLRPAGGRRRGGGEDLDPQRPGEAQGHDKGAQALEPPERRPAGMPGALHWIACHTASPHFRSVEPISTSADSTPASPRIMPRQ